MLVKFEASRLLEQHRAHHAIAIGRTKVLQLAARAEQASPFGAWHVAGRRDEGNHSVVELHGPGGSAMEMIFTVREQSRTPRVSVDARLIRAVTADTATPGGTP